MRKYLIVLLPVLVPCLYLYMVQGDAGLPLALTLLGGVLAVLIVFFGACYVFFRWRNRLSIRMLRLARTGDFLGAVAILQTYIDRHGPSAGIYSDWAVVLAMEEKWAESLRMIEKAEQLGSRTPTLMNNKGVALWKSGRLEEALSYLDEAARRRPKDLVAACNYGSVLADLGFTSQAEEELRRVERLFKDQFDLVDAGDREVRKNALDDLRRKVIGDRPE